MKNFVSKFLKGDSRTQCHQHQLNTTEVRRKDLKTDGSFKGKSGKGVGEPYGIYQQPIIEIFLAKNNIYISKFWVIVMVFTLKLIALFIAFTWKQMFSRWINKN